MYFAVGELGLSKVPVPLVCHSISTAFSVVTNPAGNVYGSVAQISALVLVNVTVAFGEISIRIVSKIVPVQGAN